MKGSSAILASFMAASTVALSSCSSGKSDVVTDRSCIQKSSRSVEVEENQRVSLKEGKLAPRFDGLKFIETLVTAHR